MSLLRKIARPWLLSLLLLVALHQVVERLLHIHIPVVDNYLDPLLLMPMLLHLLLWERRVLFKKGDLFVFSWPRMIMIFIIVSFITEYLFPLLRPGFTADIWDVLCYLIGTIIFGIFLNEPYQE